MRRLGVRPLPAGLLALTLALAAASVPLSLGREPGYDTACYGLMAAVLGLAGALVASRHPGNPIGWVLTGMGVQVALVEVAEGWAAHPGLPGAVPAGWFAAWGALVGVSAYPVLFLLFPTGRPAGRRWTVALLGSIAGGALLVYGAALGGGLAGAFPDGRNPYGVAGVGADAAYRAGQVLLLAGLLVSIGSLVARFRRSTGVERQQLKWVALAVSALAAVGPPALFVFHDSAALQVAVAAVVTVVPVAICVAILRHRLYDVDLVLNRTLVYGLLTVLLGAGYAAVALLLGTALGRDSAWATAGATLAVAGAFRPLRARLQDAVDRRFRRSAWDALRRVDAFAERLRDGRAEPEEIESVLREALSDERLRVVFDGSTADGLERTPTGRAAVLHAGTDRRLVADVLARAALPVEIARLRGEVRRQLADVEASRARIVAAGYAERRRLERDLHDGAQQRLVSIGLALRHAQHRLGPSAVTDILEDAMAEIEAAIADLRSLANGVRPAGLDGGLAAALHELAARTPLPVAVRAGPERYPDDIEAAAYFVACEAVTNAVKHAGATRVELCAERRDGRLVVSVRDDGGGGARPDGGTGLRGLSDRVAAHGGRLRLDTGPDVGTTLTAELPCAS